jgi:hypothetical protein
MVLSEILWSAYLLFCVKRMKDASVITYILTALPWASVPSHGEAVNVRERRTVVVTRLGTRTIVATWSAFDKRYKIATLCV